MKYKMITVSILAILLMACQEVPQQDVDAAKAALGAAEQAEAAKYASSALQEAQAAIKAIDDEVKVQADKFALFRNYDRTKQLIADAKTKSEAAKTAAVEGKERARKAAEEAKAQVDAALTSARDMLTALAACPRKPKGFDADLEALQSRLDGIGTEAAGIADAIGREDFSGASSQAGSLNSQLQTLITDMTSAKEKIKCK